MCYFTTIHQSPSNLNRTEWETKNSPTLTERISNIVSFVFSWVHTLVSYFVHPTLFTIGFVAGIIWNQEVQISINKITQVWKNLNWKQTCLLTVFTFFSLPGIMIVNSILSGAQKGKDLYYSSIKNVTR